VRTTPAGAGCASVSTVGAAAKAWILWPIAAALTLGILTPYALAAQRRYLVNHLKFGTARFEVELTVGPIYRILLGAGLVFIVIVAIFGAFAGFGIHRGNAMGMREAVGGSVFLAVIGVYLAAAAVAPYIAVKMTNLVLNRSNLSDHGFVSTIPAAGYVFITISNWVLTLITLGLYRPFAVVRLYEYRIAHIAMLPAGTLDDFVSAQEGEVRVLGEEAADLLDIDLGF